MAFQEAGSAEIQTAKYAKYAGARKCCTATKIVPHRLVLPADAGTANAGTAKVHLRLLDTPRASAIQSLRSGHELHRLKAQVPSTLSDHMPTSWKLYFSHERSMLAPANAVPPQRLYRIGWYCPQMLVPQMLVPQKCICGCWIHQEHLQSKA